jgi:ankyrin repeat protein
MTEMHGLQLWLLLLCTVFTFRLGAQTEAEWELLEASFAGDTARVDSLLRLEVSPNIATYDSVTPLMYAVEGGHIGITALLLQAGARPDLGGAWQTTPLMTAIELGQATQVEWLLQAGADPEKSGISGESPLMRAASVNSLEIANLLLRYGVSVDQADRRGRQAVHYASRSGAWECLAFLIDQGADPCQSDEDSVQAIHIAAAYNDLAMLDLLLKSGCDENARDKFGMSILDQAVLYRSIPVVYYLFENARDFHWSSAQIIALKTGQRDLYRIIADSTGSRIRQPVTYAIEGDIAMLWNGKDHLALASFRWIEAHSNLAASLSLGRRITPVRILTEEEGILKQFREKKWDILLGIHKIISIPGSRKMVVDLRPGLYAGMQLKKNRGSAAPYETSLTMKAEMAMGFRWNRFSLFGGISYVIPKEKEISAMYWKGGLSYRFSRMNFRKYSYVL